MATASGVLRTRICDLLDCDVPIVQTGMGWVSGARLTAATAEAGGFGILAAATMTTAELETAITKVNDRTSRAFGVNTRGDAENLDEIIALLKTYNVGVASFAGAPPRSAIDKLKENNIVSIVTIGAVRHGQKMQEWGVDAVIAQGHEGGGHTGPVPTNVLVPAVCRAVDIPVLAAGGFATGEGLVAALAWGADGVAMGTRFLLTKESQVPEPVKARYLQTNVFGTVVSSAIDGHPQRVIRTDMIEKLETAGPLQRLILSFRNAMAMRKETGLGFFALLAEGLRMRKSQELSLAQLTMAANAPIMTRASMVDGDLDRGILPTGQVVGNIEELPTVAELLDRIMAEAESALERLQNPVTESVAAS